MNRSALAARFVAWEFGKKVHDQPGVENMLGTCAGAFNPCGLDMRAGHPAENGSAIPQAGFSMPRRLFQAALHA